MSADKTLAKLARIDADIASLRDRLDNKLDERLALLTELITLGESIRAALGVDVLGEAVDPRHAAQAANFVNTGRCLTDEQVREIRKLNKDGVSQSELGRQYGLSQPTIYKIVKRQSYQDVK